MHWYGPVSGNWCWLVEKPAYMRYVLTHGWRFFFIFLEICLYTYLHIFLKRHFNNTSTLLSDIDAGTSHIPLTRSQVAVDVSQKDTHVVDKTWNKDESPYVPYSHKSHDTEAVLTSPHVQPSRAPFDTDHNVTMVHIMAHRRDDSARVRNPRLNAVEKVLLLNAYPLLYIILWIPGLANRLIEVSGHSSKVFQVLQSTTQFVGLANAFTFGWNEEMVRQLKNRFRKM